MGRRGDRRGPFRGVDDEVSITIEPGFNEAATLYDQYYAGEDQTWQLLVPNGDGVKRLALDMTASLTIETGACDDEGAELVAVPEIKAVEFKGCGEVWLVFEESFDGTVEVAIETSADWYQVEITGDDLQRVPGQFGGLSLYKWRATGNEKILAVKTPSGSVETETRAEVNRRLDRLREKYGTYRSTRSRSRTTPSSSSRARRWPRWGGSATRPRG